MNTSDKDAILDILLLIFTVIKENLYISKRGKLFIILKYILANIIRIEL